MFACTSWKSTTTRQPRLEFKRTRKSVDLPIGIGMIFRHLTSYLRKHGRLSKGAQERLSSTDSGEIKVLSTDNVIFYFHLFTIVPFRDSELDPNGGVQSSPLIRKSSLRRNNVVFTLVISKPVDLLSRYTINRVLWGSRPSAISSTRGGSWPSHRTPKPFYIALRRQKDPALRQNYALELYQVMILHLSRAGLTYWNQMVTNGHVHFTCSPNIIFLCIKYWGKKDLFQTTWT